MDANLHHPQWNPPRRSNTHPAARDLIRTCGTAGFKIVSEKGVPTFYPRRNGSPSTIDLTWGNWALSKHRLLCKTLTNTYGSDHQALQIQIPRNAPQESPEKNTASLQKLNQATYQAVVENRLSLFPSIFETDNDVTSGINQLTDVLTGAFYEQGKTVKDNIHKQKPWWDEEKLRPLINIQNCARQWMIRSQLPEAETCYWEWQKYFKQEIKKLKRRHWRAFLANSDNNLTFKALAYTLPASTGLVAPLYRAVPASTALVAPLYRADRSIATDKEEQAELLFFGTSVALTECHLSDIRTTAPPPRGVIPIIPPHEVEVVIAHLPTKKAKGPDNVQNKPLKLAKSK